MKVVLREDMPLLSQSMARIAEARGDLAADEFAQSPQALRAVSEKHGGEYRWDPTRMLWESVVSAQEKLAAAIQEYLLERDGSGYYVGSIDAVLPDGREVTVLARLEIAPRVPEPQWGE